MSAGDLLLRAALAHPIMLLPVLVFGGLGALAVVALLSDR